MAYHDSLTGLFNRNWLYRNASTIKNENVYFIDINGLHAINKKYGHIFGDQYILDIVKSIFLQKGDVFIRYAGDEFILFSDRTELRESDLYSYGRSKVDPLNVLSSVNDADQDMIKKRANSNCVRI